MRSLQFGILLSWLVSLFLFGAVQPSVAQTSSETAISVTIGAWEGERCFSKTSPELRLSSLPAEATHARIIVTDLMVPTFDHGGGRTSISRSAEGEAVIPAGGTPSYRGPCSEQDRSNPVHNYEFRVVIFNARGDVIGRGAATSLFDPNNREGRFAGKKQ